MKRSTWTFPDGVLGLFAAENMPATAHVGIDRFVDPCQFGTDLIDVGVGGRQELILRFTSSFKFFGCSLHHSIRSFIAPDEVSVFFGIERHTAE